LISLWQPITFHPTKLRPCQQHKPEKESSYESTNVSKIIGVRQYPDRQIDHNYRQKSYDGCCLQRANELKLAPKQLNRSEKKHNAFLLLTLLE
jgi:hypothetical protein